MLGVPGDASERGPADATAMTVYTELGQNGHGSALEGQKKRSYRCVFSFTRVVPVLVDPVRGSGGWGVVLSGILTLSVC